MTNWSSGISLGLLLALTPLEIQAADRTALRHPVVLIHGFCGFKQLGPFAYFNGIADHLAEQGLARVFTPALPAFNSTPVRAPILARFIDRVLAQTGARKVHIIGHSQGGIDARYLIGELGYSDRVATVTTIATPHEGTVLADIILDLPEGSLEPATGLLNSLIFLLEDPEVLPREEGRPVPWPASMWAVGQTMSHDAMRRFNQRHRMPGHIPLFSVAGYSDLFYPPPVCRRGLWPSTRRRDLMQPALLLLSMAASGGDPERPVAHDGVVATESAAVGTLLGCVPADHMQQVGWWPSPLPDPVSGYDRFALFDRIIDNLMSWEQRLTSDAETRD